MKTAHLRVALVLILGVVYATNVRAALFVDDFEGDLSLWTGLSGGAHNGAIVVDPLNAGNNVLTFTALGSGGDIFTAQQFVLTPGATYRVSFDYLGIPTLGATADDLGGFAGLSEDLPGQHLWYFGTSTVSGASDVLVDNGQWANYVYQFTVPVTYTIFATGSSNNVRLMFEDFAGSGGLAGDVYFDNIQLSEAIPEPAAVFLFGGSLLVLLGLRRRSRTRA